MINDGKKMNPFCRISLWARCGGEVNQQLQQKPKEVERERERQRAKKKQNYIEGEGLTFVVMRGFSQSISTNFLC